MLHTSAGSQENKTCQIMGQLSNSFYGYYKFNLHHDLNITFQFCPENIHTYLDGTTYGSIMITLQKKELCTQHFDLHSAFCRHTLTRAFTRVKLKVA